MIIAHMVVGPGEADRYLDQVLDRAYQWADHIHVALDPRAGEAEERIVSEYAYTYGRVNLTWEEHEGKFRQEAWWQMEESVEPSENDYIFLIDADEIVHDYVVIRKAVREFPGQRLGFVFHEMWGPNVFRIDGHWSPYPAWILIPYQRDGYFKDRALACGREPTYASTIPVSGKPVGSILHYGYAREEDRRAKHDRYMRLDGGKYHNPNHLQSILQEKVSLQQWDRGGLLDV